MAASIFESFSAGYEGGMAQAKERRRQTALALAGQQAAAGDTTAAETRLLGEGMVQEAGVVGDLGERKRARDNRERIRTAMTAPGTMTERVTRGRDAALESGDTEQAFQFDDQLNSMDDRQKAAAKDTLEWGAGQMLSILQRGVAEPERKAAMLASLQGTPYDTPAMRQRIEAQADWTDAGVKAIAQNAMSVAERFQTTERNEDRQYTRGRDEVGDQRDERDFNEQRRQFNTSEANQNARSRQANSGITPERAMQAGFAIRDDFDRAAKADVESLAQTSMVETARAKLAAGQPLSGTEKNGLLFMIARMMQGGGILTDQDVAFMRAQNLGEDAEAVANKAAGDGSKISNGLVERLVQIAEAGRIRTGERISRRIQEVEARARTNGIPSEAVFGSDPYQMYGIKRPDPNAGAPPVGYIDPASGLRYRGGGHRDRNNWERPNGAQGTPAASTGMQPYNPGRR